MQFDATGEATGQPALGGAAPASIYTTTSSAALVRSASAHGTSLTNGPGEGDVEGKIVRPRLRLT